MEKLWICTYVEADDVETIIKIENGELPEYPRHTFRVWASSKDEAIDKFVAWSSYKLYPIMLVGLKETNLKFEEV